MKRFFCALLFLVTSLSAFGGDAAAFVDIGISEDGKTYVFGEYGMTDRNFQGYAEIYAVDIEKNDFLKNGVYRTKPSADTFSKSGKDVFDALDEVGYTGPYNLELNLNTFGKSLATDAAAFGIKVLRQMLLDRYGEE